MRVLSFDQTTEAIESRGFRYKVALYLSYRHIKFDDEIKGNPLEFQASRFACVRRSDGQY